MSDVEQLTHNNQERRRWAEEVERDYQITYREIATASSMPRNDRQESRRDALWAAYTGCSMVCGVCGSFLAIGLGAGHLLTVVISAFAGGVFLITGTGIEKKIRGWKR